MKTLPSHTFLFLGGILMVAAFLVFFRITQSDMQTDGAFYSLWSVGYLDYLFSDLQTTPLQWFGYIPWWGYLSFHAHPPLVFLISHLFFRFFGESLFIARLPFALAGIASIIMTFLIANKLFGRLQAYLSALLLSFSAFFVWMSRTTYLESIETFFILLTIWLFLLFLEQKRYFVYFGASLGLMLLTKYTALPVFAGCVLYFFFYQKKEPDAAIRKERWRKFFQALIVAGVIFLPVVVYNAMVWYTRRHFDVQFSRILPWVFDAAERDWPILFSEPQNGNIVNHLISFPTVFFSLSSFPFFLLFIVSALFRAKTSSFLGILMVVYLVFFAVASPQVRYVGILLPIFALLAADGIIWMIHQLKRKRSVVFTLLIVVLSFELMYNINTNHLTSPIGKKGIMYSPYRREDLGFQALEDFLSESWKKIPSYTDMPQRVRTIADTRFTDEDLNGSNLYIYENGLQWFATTWHLQRYRLYHGVPIASDADIRLTLRGDTNWFGFFKERGVVEIFFIRGTHPSVLTPFSDQRASKSEFADYLEERFLEASSTPFFQMRDIFNRRGERVFRVYRLQLNDPISFKRYYKRDSVDTPHEFF